MNDSMLINTSSQDSTVPSTHQSTNASEAVRIFRVTIFAICTLASLLVNVVVCKAVREIPSLKSYSYYLVTNLAVAEIVRTISLPFSFFYIEFHQWPFGEFACMFVLPLQNTAMIVVTGTLATIAVYRHMFLVRSRPLLRSWIALAVTVVSLWFAALLISTPLFLKAEVTKGHCLFHRSPGYKLYSLVKFTFSFGVPYIVMLAAYGRVASEVKLHKMKRKRTQRPLREEYIASTEEVTLGDDNVLRTSTRRRENNDSDRDMENDLLRMINAIVIVFVISYIPYQVMFLFYHTGNRVPTELGPFPLVLTNLSGAIHPLLYGTMNKFYAKAFSKLVMWTEWSADKFPQRDGKTTN